MCNCKITQESVRQVINIIKEQGDFTENGYFCKNPDEFTQSVEKAVINKWKFSKTRDKYEDPSDLVKAAAIAFDRYALELYELLLPRDMTKPQTCPLYRTTHYYIRRYKGLEVVLSADEAMAEALDIILGKKLAILTFKGNSTLKTWVMGIIINIVKGKARDEGIIGNRPTIETVPDPQAYSKKTKGLPFENQPDKLQDHIHWLSCRLHFFVDLIQQGETEKSQADRKTYPKLEQAWLIWNDFYADYYIEYTNLVGNDHEFSSLKFPIPPEEKKSPDKKGGHNPTYSEYLAVEIGRLREWPSQKIEEDLSLPRAPKDQSRLRAAVRTRRNEGKRIIAYKDLKISK